MIRLEEEIIAAARPPIRAQIDNSGGYVRSAGNITLSWDNTGSFSSNRNSGGGVTPYNWLLAGAPADAEIFIHQNSGNAVTGVTLDTWLSLGTTRTLSQTWPGGVGSSAFSITVQIRDRVTGVVVAGPTTIAGGTSP